MRERSVTARHLFGVDGGLACKAHPGKEEKRVILPDEDENEAPHDDALGAVAVRRAWRRRSNNGTPAPDKIRAPITQRSQ